jgi:hypothetical protein
MRTTRIPESKQKIRQRRQALARDKPNNRVRLFLRYR